MNKTGHLAMGIIFGGIFVMGTHFLLKWFNALDITSIILIIGIIYVYSLLADIDMKNSAIVWTFIPIGLFAILAGYLLKQNMYMILGIGLLVVTFVAAQFFPHRGFTHSVAFGVLVSLPFLYFSYEYSILALVVFYSHLVADEEWDHWI